MASPPPPPLTSAFLISATFTSKTVLYDLVKKLVGVDVPLLKAMSRIRVRVTGRVKVVFLVRTDSVF